MIKSSSIGTIIVSFAEYQKDPSKFWDKTREGYDVIVKMSNNRIMLLGASGPALDDQLNDE